MRSMTVRKFAPLSSRGASPTRPSLDLSGPRLRAAFESLVRASEPIGGIERFAEALKLKSEVFRQRLADGQVKQLGLSDFDEISVLMPTVRRRMEGLLADEGWAKIHSTIISLLDQAHVPGTADDRMAAFCRSYPDTKRHRFVRDLAAEILHYTLPEHYPLATRWVWDSKTNTGALREVWHGDDVDHMIIDVPDTHETFLVLREELSQFLSDNGIFRDMIWYVDLLLGQTYGDYINSQGGAFLKTDFGSESDPLEHSRRILGVDARVARRSTQPIEGTAKTADDIKRLS